MSKISLSKVIQHSPVSQLCIDIVGPDRETLRDGVMLLNWNVQKRYLRLEVPTMPKRLKKCNTVRTTIAMTINGHKIILYSVMMTFGFVAQPYQRPVLQLRYKSGKFYE
jgi:hypothetical protein